MNHLNSNSQAGWRNFEDYVSKSIRSILDNPTNSKLLQNRCLGDKGYPEVDLLFPIKLDGIDSVIIIECKYREIMIQDGALFVRDISLSSSFWEPMVRQLSRQVCAAEKLQIHTPRVLVVGLGQRDCMTVMNPNLVVVQICDSDYPPEDCPEILESGWKQISAGAEQLTMTSDLHKKVCALPRKGRAPYNPNSRRDRLREAILRKNLNDKY